MLYEINNHSFLARVVHVFELQFGAHVVPQQPDRKLGVADGVFIALTT